MTGLTKKTCNIALYLLELEKSRVILPAAAAAAAASAEVSYTNITHTVFDDIEFLPSHFTASCLLSYFLPY